MQTLIVFSALCAIALAAPSAPVVPPVILSKVQVAAPQITVVKQPYTIQEPELVYRNVPVPIKAVTYTAPAVVHHPVPVAYAAPVHYAAPAVAYAAPAVAYGAPGLGYAAHPW